MVAAMGGQGRALRAPGPLGAMVDAEYGVCRRGEDVVVVMEMAAASGMWLLGPDERDVMRASTAGTGYLIRHAAKRENADLILLGIGGSATNDGGA